MKPAISILGSLLLFALMIHVPSAISSPEYAEGDYLHHLWKQQEDSTRRNELMKEGQTSNRTKYCAVAYAKSTRNWGYGWGKSTQEEAEQEALKDCDAADAEVLLYASDMWYLAFAKGPDSHGAGVGETAELAEARALQIGNEAYPGCKIVLLLRANSAPIILVKDTDVGQQYGTPAATSPQYKPPPSQYYGNSPQYYGKAPVTAPQNGTPLTAPTQLYGKVPAALPQYGVVPTVVPQYGKTPATSQQTGTVPLASQQTKESKKSIYDLVFPSTPSPKH